MSRTSTVRMELNQNRKGKGGLVIMAQNIFKKALHAKSYRKI